MTDSYHSPARHTDRLADCPGCNPHPRRLGTPISELSGRPGTEGYARFAAVARSWGYP